MSLVSQAVGVAIAEWAEDEPFRFVMRETRGEGKRRQALQISVDLTPFLVGYSRTFLTAIKDVLIARRQKIALRSVQSELGALRGILRYTQDHFAAVTKEQGLAPIVFERLDSDFLLGVAAIADKIPSSYLTILKSYYTANCTNLALFSPELQPGDFPRREDGGGFIARTRQNIVAKALSRSALVEILNITEAAYEVGQLDLARYSFSRLMLSRAARPETYRLILCKDLRIDLCEGVATYYLSLTIPKGRSPSRPQADIRIHPEVGQILAKQREAVVARLGKLVEQKNSVHNEEKRSSYRYTAGDLPLFPALSAAMHARTKDHLGQLLTSTEVIRQYVKPLKELTNKEMSCTAMRHTMGTQLAIAGCSSSTIGAVLLHATNLTARIYTDLIFEGAIDALSDSMEDAFAQHFPVYKEFCSSREPIDPATRIRSESSDRTRWETTGKCGRDRLCEYAPLSCYECHRFMPAYDVDHQINLDVVNEEIQAAEVGGLQRQADLLRYRHIAGRIQIVINICKAKHAAAAAERTESSSF